MNRRTALASVSAYWAPAAASTDPIASSPPRTCRWVPCHSATTPWKRADAWPVQASCSATSRAIIVFTWPSISPEMRAMSAEAAWMRSVSTWNCVAMGSLPV